MELTEKFLSGKIHGQEWLTELDLARMAAVCGIEDKLSIARFNVSDVGKILHLNRKKNSATDKYSIPLLLNKGNSGDISSQGAHWVSVILNVDPANKAIEIVFRDSLHMSCLEQEKVKAELTKALHYKETSLDIPPKLYQAFPGYKLDFNMVALNATPLPYNENWSCGYHAFKSLVDQAPFIQITNNALDELKKVSAEDATTANLRRIFYRNLLASLEISTSALDPSILDNLIQMLRVVKEKHPTLLNQCIKLLEGYYATNTDKRVINAITDVLEVMGDNAEIKSIYFRGLSGNVNAFLSISDSLLLDVAVAQRADFAKIIAYSCLEQEADAKEIITSQAFVDQLKDLSKTPEFAELAKLYQDRPYPKLIKLKQFLAIKNPIERQQFINNYELDPPGLMSSREDLEKLFDLSGIDQRIDGIRDLARDIKNPLFYTQRQKLMEQVAFVNSLGYTHYLSVPGISAVFPDGANKASYNKPTIKLTKQQIRDLIKHYREMISHADRYTSAEINLAKLEFAAVARIAMYRTTGGKLPYSTQMLSLLNVMLHDGNIYSEIRTGEGKGGITALFAATKWMEGGAVDVCSSNMELASRDLEEFGDFYEYLGIDTQLIRAKTKPGAYQQDGINYSDVSELALFQQQADLFHHPLPSKMSCILDECDFTALDNVTQFRFATSLDESFDPHFNPNEALYPAILEFVASEKFLNKTQPLTAQEDIQALKQFISSHTRLKNAVKTRFSKIDDVQLDRWIDSAYTASQLIEGEDFVVRDSTIVREGQSISVQVAKVKVLHRESADSSFSNGVHQFLHARLNLQIAANTRSGKKFPIEPEKTYLASKSAKNFMDYYLRKGNVLGLTGTAGSNQEIKEMRKNYGFKFYKIPPHKPLTRKDHAPILATRQRTGWLWLSRETAEQAHFRTILAKVREFRRRGQPIVVFCDGVQSSTALHEFLLKNLGADKLQLYNGEQLGVREKDITHNAGLSQMITVTTPMLGRGTDFKPHDDNGNVIPEGLAVLDTAISPDRDSGQKIGRSGRNNARGDTQLIVSEAEFAKHAMKIPKGEKALALAVEKIQAKVNDENFKQRRERQYFADIKDQFFNQYTQSCRNIKKTIETFYQKSAATGAADTWQQLQHQCHLVWEQFLNKLDSRWNDLVVELHNDLGKIAVDQRPLTEKQWLQDKVASLTEFANTAWAETSKTITTASNDQLTADFVEVSARTTQTQPLNAEIAALLAPNIQLPTFKAQAFSLPVVPIYEESALNISYNPINAAQVNVDKVYLNLTGSKSPTDQKNIFISELNIIYNTLFQADAETSGYGLVTIARISLKKLLDDYHANFVADAVGRDQTSTIALYFRLMNSISKYSNDHFKQAAYDAYTSHIHDYRDDANYVHLLANNMFAMRNAGALPADAAITHEKLLGMSDDMVWKDIKQFAENELDKYGWAIFKSNDRVRVLDGLRKRLKAISNGAYPASEKITKLIDAIQEASAAAAKNDLAHDKKKSKWNIFAYRNVEGSRFQKLLTNIQDKATSFAVVMPDTKLPNEQSIAHLQTLLTQLVDRTDLTKVKKHPIISQIHADSALIAAIQRLESNAELVESDSLQDVHKDLLFIYHRLKAYAKHFEANADVAADSSLSAYANFMDNIIVKLKKFQFAQETQELAAGGKSNNFYTSGAYTLRQNIQNRVESLLRSDYVAGKNINIKKFAKVLPVDSAAVKLAQSVLFEMERSLKLQYPRVKGIELIKDETSYVGDTLTAGFKLVFQNNETFTLPMVVNSLSKEPAVKDFAFVELPAIKGETVAPVRNKHIVASGVLQPVATPSVVDRSKKPSAQVTPLSPGSPKNTK
jgi:hypothetical protein